MSEKINHKMKTFLASSLIQTLKNQNPVSWKELTYYNIGSKVLSDDKIFVAVSTGTTSTIAPTHSSGILIDGTVQWLFLQSATSTKDISSNLYLGIGRPDLWNDSDTPDVAETTSNKEDEALTNALTFIRLSQQDVRIGLEIVEWQTGQIYSMFDPDTELKDFGSLIPSMHVMVGDNIYKCIDNNGGALSTDEPTGTQTGLVLMSDGYIWKFMGTVDALDKIPFSTNFFVPVSLKLTNDASAQWDVQQAAKDGSISSFKEFVSVGDFFSEEPIAEVVGDGAGATAGVAYNLAGGEYTLTRIYATAGGQDYTQETYAVVKETGAVGSGATLDLSITGGVVSAGSLVGGSGYTGGAVLVIIGDGVGAVGTLTISSGVVTVADITDGGTGYTWAKAFIIPGTAGAVSRALMAPVGGHGRDIVTELGARTLIFSKTINATLEPYVVDGEYRQAFLVSSIQPSSGSGVNAALYIGPKHPEFSLNPNSLDKYETGTGEILVLNNFEAVTHSSVSEETIKIALTF